MTTHKIAIVGEAWGEQEERQLTPFVGASGYELTRMLDEAGIRRADCYLTNVFNLRPRPTNDIENLCTGKSEGIVGLGPVTKGKYLRTEYASKLARLQSELRAVKPNIIIALGNTAVWGLGAGSGGITKIRGTVNLGTRHGAEGIKVLPTFHPAAILREWSNRPVTVLDFAKAKRESEFPEIRRPECLVHIAESLDDLEFFYDRYLVSARQIAFDIETSGDQITCIGFAPSREIALVIPFVDPRRTEPADSRGSYWRNHAEEVAAWRYVRRVLDLPCRKFGQNTLYDINFLWTKYGIAVRNYSDDTMLLHHALQPESQKGLGFLGSVYTNHSSWKLMNRKGVDTIKRDE